MDACAIFKLGQDTRAIRVYLLFAIRAADNNTAIIAVLLTDDLLLALSFNRYSN